MSSTEPHPDGISFAPKMSMKFILLLIFFLPYAEAREGLFATEVSPKEAWEYLLESRYQTLPHEKVTYRSFFSAIGENLLEKDSKRTVDSGDHFIPFQRKLLFPNGICVRGEWTIDQHDHNYSGHFNSGSKSVVIGRAAVSLSNVNYKELRSLALSGKIFPTTNPNEERPLPAANFLTMNDNAGKKRTYLTEANLTNAAPRTVSFAALPLIRVALQVASAFDKADVRRDMRQLYPIAELDASPPYRSPKWIKLNSDPKLQVLSHQLGAEDFRDEVKQVIDTNKSLDFDIMVADDLVNGQPKYHRIGKIVFTEYVASRACDESLHFQHAPYLEEYAAPPIDQKFKTSKR